MYINKNMYIYDNLIVIKLLFLVFFKSRKIVVLSNFDYKGL